MAAVLHEGAVSDGFDDCIDALVKAVLDPVSLDDSRDLVQLMSLDT